MSSLTSGNITSGFVDLATFDELEKYLYGGPDATAYFVRETRKATWFTQVPVVLSRAAGNPAFGTEWSVSISRAGDYLLNTWLRVTLPSVALASTGNTNNQLRWTRNVMHALVEECALTFNDLVAARFDTYHLDFWSAFTVPAGKKNGYDNMIGMVEDATSPVVGDEALPQLTLNLPLPFFFCRDSGVALPTAALPYNDMRINFKFRNWNQLLCRDDFSDGSSAPPTASQLNGGAPTLVSANVWGNYAIVSNDERKKMACAPRDILIEQVQTAPSQTFTPATNTSQSFDIRFSHAIKVLFFAVRNTTWSSDWANYTTRTPEVGTDTINFVPTGSADPILQTSLIYENTNRLAQMGSDYYSLVQPWYNAPTIPTITGYHMYSYSLDFICLDPKGSTNYGKLTNVSIVPEASSAAQNGANGKYTDSSGTLQDLPSNQTYEFRVTCVNNNIIRISGGALGFPVL